MPAHPRRRQKSRDRAVPTSVEDRRTLVAVPLAVAVPVAVPLALAVLLAVAVPVAVPPALAVPLALAVAGVFAVPVPSDIFAAALGGGDGSVVTGI